MSAMISGEVPRRPYTTRLDTFILLSTVLVFLSLVQEIITATLSREEHLPLARRIDVCSRVVAPVIFALVTLFSLVV